MPSRRDFNTGLFSAAAAGLALSGCGKLALLSEIPGFRTRAMIPAPEDQYLVPDPAGLIDLPPGFSYRAISCFRDEMDDGHVVPNNADGMGAFRVDDRLMVLVRNHELDAADAPHGPYSRGTIPDPSRTYLPAAGPPLPGGTTTIIYDYRAHTVQEVRLSLSGTDRNCSGGATPWGSWLTCEESEEADHGWVFEVPATGGGGNPRPLRQLGRFRHEAAAVDPSTNIIYLTEDQADGLFYRFLPDRREEPLGSGRLQALAYADLSLRPESRNWDGPESDLGRTPRPVRWITLDDVACPGGDLRSCGRRAGAVKFARGEGIHFGQDEVFFCCTGGGPIRSGQIMRYRPSTDEIALFLESTDPAALNYCDNLTMAPNGDLFICEDAYVGGTRNFLPRDAFKWAGYHEGTYLRGITPEGQTYRIAHLRLPTELAGACFSPDGRTLFVNVYKPAKTLAITGPWGWDRPAEGWSITQARPA